MIGRRHSVDRSFDGLFRFDGHAELELDGPPLPFQVSLPVPLGIGNLGRRVATAFSSARKIISVSGFMPAQGDPEEWPLCTRRAGVCLYLPCPEMHVRRAGVGGLGRKYSNPPAPKVPRRFMRLALYRKYRKYYYSFS